MHGDYRLDNLMFAPPSDGGVDVWALDWQTLSLALPARDLAYFLGTSLVGRGPARQRARPGRGVPPGAGRSRRRRLLRDECWDDYCFAMVQGPLVAVFGCAYGTRTERGDTMFAAMARRACAAIRDHDTPGPRAGSS